MPFVNVTTAFALCTPNVRCEQLIENGNAPPEEVVLVDTFLPSTKNETETTDVPLTVAFARLAGAQLCVSCPGSGPGSGFQSRRSASIGSSAAARRAG